MDSINTGTDELLCHIYERVATITLNKPQKKMPWEAMLKKHKTQQAVHGKKNCEKK